LQFDGPPLQVPIPYIPNSVFCPVLALRCLYAIAPLPLSQPLFSFTADEWVTYYDLRSFIWTLAAKAGLDPDLYGCHSARSGGATFASEAGASAFQIKAQGI
jgi:hypothetical protein